MRLSGSCWGGLSDVLFLKNKTNKLPVETCKIYSSKNPAEFGTNV